MIAKEIGTGHGIAELFAYNTHDQVTAENSRPTTSERVPWIAHPRVADRRRAADDAHHAGRRRRRLDSQAPGWRQQQGPQAAGPLRPQHVLVAAGRAPDDGEEARSSARRPQGGRPRRPDHDRRRPQRHGPRARPHDDVPRAPVHRPGGGSCRTARRSYRPGPRTTSTDTLASRSRLGSKGGRSARRSRLPSPRR